MLLNYAVSGTRYCVILLQSGMEMIDSCILRLRLTPARTSSNCIFFLMFFFKITQSELCLIFECGMVENLGRIWIQICVMTSFFPHKKGCLFPHKIRQIRIRILLIYSPLLCAQIMPGELWGNFWGLFFSKFSLRHLNKAKNT
jgi:membrane protein CcdC involved in cytochrome C biogenesis